jgi:hypothetical protein
VGFETALPAVIEAAQKDGLLKQIYGDLAQPGVQQVGKALSGVFGLGNTILWPLHLLNSKAQIALQKNLDEFKERMASKPLESVIEVAPEVGVPIAEKITYVQDDDLRALYLSLLEKSASATNATKAHPSFVNVINNLSPDEARLIADLGRRQLIPVVTGNISRPGDHSEREVVPMILAGGAKLNAPQNVRAYLSNLEGLGIIKIDFEKFYSDESLYSELVTLATERIQPHLTSEFSQPSVTKGRILFTEFGRLFMQACLS